MSSVASATERGVRVVAPVSPIPSPADVTQDATTLRSYASSKSEAGAQSSEDRAQAAALAAAAYAKVRAGVTSVIASLSTQGAHKSPAVLAQAENSLLALMPQPTVVLALPPADQKTVEFVAQVTQSIARQAAQTRAALSGITAATVDAATTV